MDSWDFTKLSPETIYQVGWNSGIFFTWQSKFSNCLVCSKLDEVNGWRKLCFFGGEDAGGSRFTVVSNSIAGWHPRSLYICAAWNPAPCFQVQGACASYWWCILNPVKTLIYLVHLLFCLMCSTPSCMHLATFFWQRTVWVWDIWTFRPISLVFSSIPKDHYSLKRQLLTCFEVCRASCEALGAGRTRVSAVCVPLVKLPPRTRGTTI